MSEKILAVPFMSRGDEIISVTDNIIAVKEPEGTVRVYRYFINKTGYPEIADRTFSIVPAIHGTEKKPHENDLCERGDWDDRVTNIFGWETHDYQGEELPF